MAANMTIPNFRIAFRDAWAGVCTSQRHEQARVALTQALNNTLETWECFTVGLLALDLVITLYGLGAKIPDTVLPISNEIALIAFTELIILIQLMQILLPVYPAEEFAMFAMPKAFTNQSLCKWVTGLFGLQEAEFSVHRPKLNENGLKAFGVFLLPVFAAVVWKLRRVLRRQRDIAREEQAILIARALRVWDDWRHDG